MKIALVDSTSSRRLGGTELRVEELAQGLALRGAQVDVLIHGSFAGPHRSSTPEGVSVTRFPSLVGRPRQPRELNLMETLQLMARSHDLVDAHTSQLPVALAVSHSRFRHRVFTPGFGIKRLITGPRAGIMRNLVHAASQTVCASEVERSLLCRKFPVVADQTCVITSAVEYKTIQAAIPFLVPGHVILAVGRLEKCARIDRAIATLPSLGPAFRLVILGEGPARNRLRAFAVDLQISSRVTFVGTVSDSDLHRWVRTARVVVALSDGHDTVPALLAAIAASVPVVASNTPAHREALELGHSGRLALVPADGSPLRLAECIAAASELEVPAATIHLPTREAVIDRTWDLYQRLAFEPRRELRHRQRRSRMGHGAARDVPAPVGSPPVDTVGQNKLAF